MKTNNNLNWQEIRTELRNLEQTVASTVAALTPTRVIESDAVAILTAANITEGKDELNSLYQLIEATLQVNQRVQGVVYTILVLAKVIVLKKLSALEPMPMMTVHE